MKTISYTEAQNNLKSIIDTVAEEHEAIRIGRRDGENAVLLSESGYNGLQETLYLLNNPANAQRLLEAKNHICPTKRKPRLTIIFRISVSVLGPTNNWIIETIIAEVSLCWCNRSLSRKAITAS